MEKNIEVTHTSPEPEEYLALRAAAGLSPRDLEGARIALRNSIFTVVLRDSDKRLIGMGRIIGDGGCFYQIVDIAVSPDHQGKGYSKIIMSEIMNYLDEHAPKNSYASLIADVPADRIYRKYGFDYTAPQSVGMYKNY
ncbi:GNAT family N-acetyltransferase [Cohnella sp. AR92]|uniref:GNAT family N-acetyltransferase n=1 Tax=Cohnella sp. AR92 TaxID=648716 RepID=UPI000F8D72DF|nr:GNAT family N-acetyltransferase [Cohnella sp. AR92]RUS47404.1 N-acetyltransferase [Cohnella sp. AR92]